MNKRLLNALYLGVNFKYINPNYQNYFRILESVFNMDYVGPGFEISDIDSKIDRYQFVIVDATLLFYQGQLSALRGGHKKARKKNIHDFYSRSQSVIRELNNVILIFNYDPYHISQKEIDILWKVEPYILCLPKEFWAHTDLMKNIQNESFYEKVNNNWHTFVNQYNHKIIPIQGVILDSEFYLSNLSNRAYDINIPGVEYFRRKVMFEVVRNNTSIKLSQHTSLKRKALSRFLRFTGSASALRLYQGSFVKQLRNSKSCYTNGSELGYAIRKYFEIPANGSLLLCDKFYGFDNFGFVDGCNCIVVNEHSIEDVVLDIKESPDKYHDMQRNAFNLIKKTHGEEARKIQLRSAIDKIQKNSFAGGFWKSGQMELY